MSDEARWWKHALLLLRLDRRVLWNSLRMQAALSIMMVGMIVFFPVFILAQVGFVWARQPFHLEGVIALAAVFGFLTSFSPFNRPEGAQPPMALPISDRAVFAHGVLRAVVGTGAGYGLLLGPACALLVAFGNARGAEVALRMFAVVGASTAAAIFGRAAYGAAARWSAHMARILRFVVLLWLSLPALLFLARADNALLLDVLGPLGLIARVAGWAADAPGWVGLGVGVGFLLVAAAAILVPAAGQNVGSRARRRGAGRFQAAAAARTRTPLPQAEPSARRKYEPLPIPRGAPEALGYLSRLWMRSVLYVAGYVAIAGGIGVGLILWHPTLPRVALPPIDIRVVMAAFYLIFLWSVGVLAAPESQEWLQARLSRQPRMKKGTAKAIFRVGPPPLNLKRWPILQTLPLDRAVMERAFLRPQLVLLVLGSFALWTMFFWFGAGAPVAVVLATAITLTLVLMLGGVLVSSRSSKRFAKEYDRILVFAHQAGAALWMGAAFPLAMMGLFVLLELSLRGTLSVPGAMVLGTWVAAGAAMPAYAYYSAYERLITTQRPFESKGRVTFVAGAGMVFAGIPIAFIFVQLFG